MTTDYISGDVGVCVGCVCVLTLTANRSQNGPKLAIDAAAPSLHRTRKFLS